MRQKKKNPSRTRVSKTRFLFMEIEYKILEFYWEFFFLAGIPAAFIELVFPCSRLSRSRTHQTVTSDRQREHTLKFYNQIKTITIQRPL